MMVPGTSWPQFVGASGLMRSVLSPTVVEQVEGHTKVYILIVETEPRLGLWLNHCVS